MESTQERPIIPEFATEADEAQWWDDHRDMVEEQMIQAIDNGTVGRGGPARIIRERAERPAISISLSPTDIAVAQTRADEQGLPLEAYLAALVHKALQ